MFISNLCIRNHKIVLNAENLENSCSYFLFDAYSFSQISDSLKNAMWLVCHVAPTSDVFIVTVISVSMELIL